MDRRHNYTERFRRMMELSRVEAHRSGRDSVTPEHLLTAMLMDPDSIAHKTLRTLTGDPKKIINQLKDLPHNPQQIQPEQIPLDPDSARIIQSAVETSRKTSRTTGEYIGTEHVLMEILRDNTTPAAAILTSLGVTVQNLAPEVKRIS